MAVSLPRAIVCDVSVLGEADAELVELLARLQLAAVRQSRPLHLLNATLALHHLIAFAGLEVVLRVELEREAEERENPLGVEEERQLDDPAL